MGIYEFALFEVCVSQATHPILGSLVIIGHSAFWTISVDYTHVIDTCAAYCRQCTITVALSVATVSVYVYTNGFNCNRYCSRVDTNGCDCNR